MTNISILAERCDIAQENIHYTPEKYLSSSFLDIKGNYYALKGGTGFGGTTAALESMGKPIMLFTFNVSQVTSKREKYEKSDYRNKKGRKVFFRYGKQETGEDSPHDWKNIVEHQGACNVFSTIDQLIHDGFLRDWVLQNFDIIIDESHLFATNAAFKDKKYGEGIMKLIRMAEGTPCRIIFTSATPFPFEKLGINIPTHLFHTDGHGERVSLTHYTDADRKSTLAVIQEKVIEGKPVYLFTNDIRLLKEFQAFVKQEVGEDVDFLVGGAMAKKLGFYINGAIKSVDPTKRFHAISSAGWVGIDIHDSEAEAIVFGEYSSAKLKNHLLIGEEDLFQIKGRFRTGYKSFTLYTKGNELPSHKEEDSIEAVGYNWRLSDAFKVTNEYKSSARFKYTRRSLKKHLKPKRKDLTLTEAYKTIQPKAYKIAKYPASYIQHTGADDEKLNKKIISGARVQDILFTMIVGYLGEMDDIIKMYERDRLDKSIKDIVCDFYDILNLILFKEGYMREGYFSLLLVSEEEDMHLNSVKRKALYDAIKAKVHSKPETLVNIGGVGGDWTFSDTLYNNIHKNGQSPSVSLINTTTSEEETLLTIEHTFSFIENYFFLFNAYAPLGSKAYTMATEHKGDKTKAQAIKNYRESVLALWMVLNGRDISTHKRGREYNKFVEGYKNLRHLLPYELLEVDGVSCALQVLAGWLKGKGQFDFYNKLQTQDIYNIEGKTRTEAKVYVNKMLNKEKYGSQAEQINDLQEIGLSEVEAMYFTFTFNKDNKWYDYYTKHEEKIMELLKGQVGGRGARLHDAMYFVNAEVNYVPDFVTLSIEGKPYEVPLKSKLINGKQNTDTHQDIRRKISA